MNIHPQAMYLYKGKWSPQADDLLLSTAMQVKSTLHDNHMGVPDGAIFEAGVKMVSDLGVHFSLSEMKERVTLYEARYRTFKRVVATPGARWDTTNKVVDASDAIWAEMLKVICHSPPHIFHAVYIS